jgi:hypothetical protein
MVIVTRALTGKRMMLKLESTVTSTVASLSGGRPGRLRQRVEPARERGVEQCRFEERTVGPHVVGRERIHVRLVEQLQLNDRVDGVDVRTHGVDLVHPPMERVGDLVDKRREVVEFSHGSTSLTLARTRKPKPQCGRQSGAML